MDLKAISTIIMSGVRYRSGAVIRDVTPAQAEALVAAGHAKIHDEPGPTPAPAPKPEPKPAQAPKPKA